MNKTAIIILSDPKTNTEESLGRVFNAMASAYDYNNNGDDVVILFQGTGTRWPALLQDENHPLHGLYNMIESNIRGVSSGCAAFFEADEPSDIEYISENQLPGTNGLPSFSKLQNDGYSIITF